MMERHRERYNEQQEPNRNSQSANSSSWSSDDHRPNFSIDHNHNHHSEHHFNNNHHHHHHHHMNSETNDPYGGGGGGGFRSNGGGGGGGYNSGWKRGFHHSSRRPSPDHIDAGSFAKLYVAQIPRTATEEDIRPLFEEHGNIVEVILPRDKRSGQQQGYCFVKYAACEEADIAILALNNRYTFPGELAPIKVRYADGEREREREREPLGLLLDKLYVGCLNKHASKEEIDEIFSPYGQVEDIYIVRDELKQNRGFAFVQFSHREMALAAIKALNGIFTMRGCDQPLIVRLANPKKPRIGEPRGNYANGSPNFGPHSQEPVARPASNFGDSIGGHVLPDASFPVQQISTNSQPQGTFHWANQEAAPPSVMQQPHLIQPSTQNLEQQPNLQVSRQESSWTGGNFQTVANISAAPAVPQGPEMVAPLECDWSEHTCPDGDKYYYNCVTCESRWGKPEEFALFEQQLQKQSTLQNSGQLHSPSTGLSHQVAQTQEELDRVQIQSETSPIISPTCV